MPAKRQTPPPIPNGNVPVSNMDSSICEHQDSVTLPNSPRADELEVPATDPTILLTRPGPRWSRRLTRRPAYLKDCHLVDAMKFRKFF